MDKYLYFKSSSFGSNKDLANWFRPELIELGIDTEDLIDEGYMYVLPTKINGQVVNFYLGKSDEICSPPLWQVWPEQKVPFLTRVFGKADLSAEEKAREYLKIIVNNFEGATEVEWDSI